MHIRKLRSREVKSHAQGSDIAEVRDNLSFLTPKPFDPKVSLSEYLVSVATCDLRQPPPPPTFSSSAHLTEVATPSASVGDGDVQEEGSVPEDVGFWRGAEPSAPTEGDPSAVGTRMKEG